MAHSASHLEFLMALDHELKHLRRRSSTFEYCSLVTVLGILPSSKTIEAGLPGENGFGSTPGDDMTGVYGSCWRAAGGGRIGEGRIGEGLNGIGEGVEGCGLAGPVHKAQWVQPLQR